MKVIGKIIKIKVKEKLYILMEIDFKNGFINRKGIIKLINSTIY